MRSVSTRFLRAAALLTLLATLVVPTTHAEEVDGSLGARITPPGGVAASGDEDTGFFEAFLEWLNARIHPPIG